VRFLRALLGISLLAGACTTTDPVSAPASAPPKPIADSSPYLCSLVPEQAIRLMFDASGPITDLTSGAKTSGQCSAPRTHPYLLYIAWSQEDGKRTREDLNRLLADKKRVYSQHGGVSLPADLGDGMVAKVPSGLPNLPYEAAVKFPCGGKERYLTFSIAAVAQGRDAFQDMIELLRIVQKRYAELNKCDIGND
jgi:hypothetical protein